jgi:flagellar biosynthetic protein FliQ
MGFTVELAAVTPTIAVLLAIGLATAIFQSAFQIEDATFSLLPKTIAMIIIALFGGFGALYGFEQLASVWIGHAGQLIRQPWS